ncbi:MAG: hypothetical protein ACJ73S_30625 [Mycobacteriales bacterium]
MEEPPLPHRVDTVHMPPDSDWTNLERSSNPLPGSVEDVYQCGYFFRMIARDLGKASGDLARAKDSSNGAWKGRTAQAFRDRIGDAPAKLGLLRDRFFKIAAALESFAPDLASAQADGKAALVDARDHQRPAMKAAAQEAGVGEMYYVHPSYGIAPSNGAQPTDPARKAALARLQAASDGYQADVKKLQAAERARDDAANRCAGRLDTAGQDALTDVAQAGLPIFRFLKQAMQVVYNVANWVGCIAGIAALVCAIIPPLQVLVPIFAAIAVIAGVFALFTDVGLMCTGQKDWDIGQLLLDGIGILPFGRIAKGLAALKYLPEEVELAGKVMKNVENGRLLTNDSKWLPKLFGKIGKETNAVWGRRVSRSFSGQFVYQMEKMLPKVGHGIVDGLKSFPTSLWKTYGEPFVTVTKAAFGHLPEVEPFDPISFRGDLFQSSIGNFYNPPPCAKDLIKTWSDNFSQAMTSGNWP